MIINKMIITDDIEFGFQRLSFLQTDEWAIINSLFNKAKLFKINDSNNKALGCFFYKDSTPWYKLVLKKMLGISSGLLECHAGPVFSDGCTEDNILEFIANILSCALNNKISKIFISTNTFSNPTLINYFVMAAQRKGFFIQKTYNPVVDLRQSYQEISLNFRNSARTGARKAIQSGAQIKRCNVFSEYYNFAINSSNIKKNTVYNVDKYKKFWNYYSSKYSFFYSEIDGVILSLLGTYENDGVVTPISSCITQEGLQRKIPVQDLMFSEVIKYHKNKGNDFFELTPIIFDDNLLTEKEKGIRLFKMKWSKQFIIQYYLEKTL